MTGTVPTSPMFKSYTLNGEFNIHSSETENGRGFRRDSGGGLWNLSVKYKNLTRAERAIIVAFFTKQRGNFDSFKIGFPEDKTAQGTPTGTPKVNGASQVGGSVITDGWTASTLIYKANDLIKFTHNKIYRVDTDITTNGSGQATIPITHDLFESLPDDDPIIVSNVEMTVTLVSAFAPEYKARSSEHYNVDVDMREFI